MADPISYKTITLHSKRGDSSAEEFRLAMQGIPYADLIYDDPTENNRAVATWFRDDLGIAPDFGDSTILTYEEVIWIDPKDPQHQYTKVKYLLNLENLPVDFITKAV